MKNLVLPLVFILSLSCQSTESGSEAHCDLVNGILSTNEVECGSILVPENHDEKNGKKIKISYLIIKAKNADSKDPVIHFTGGPGGPALTKGRIRNWAQHPFREERDIIMFDQRGLGFSSEIPNIESELLEIMAGNFTYDEELDKTIDIISRYQQICKKSNIELANYNSFQNAEDVGRLMQHLGYDKYNLYGGSYGTRLARIVQDKFPNQLNAVIHNSPSPLTGDFLVDRLKNYTKALQRVFDFCETDNSCSQDYPDLKGEYLMAISNLQKNPVQVDVDGRDFYINVQDGIYLIRRILYRNDSRTKIPQLIRALSVGEGSIIDETVAFELQFSGGFNASMMMAIERHEQYNPAHSPTAISEYYASSELLPAKLGYFNSLYEACRNWHTNVLSEEEKEFKKSTVPTMITVNQYDPVTPPEYGALFQKTLEHSQLYVLDEGGHGGGNAQCRNSVMISFMNNPLGKIDTSCLNIYKK